MRPRKVKRYVIDVQEADVIRGEMIVANQFPESNPGLNAPSGLPTVSDANDFVQWVDYYAASIARFLERLNGIQWGLEDDPDQIPQQRALFRTTFIAMATFLEVPPTETLTWPLHGAYSFHRKDDPQLEGAEHQLDLFFESDELYGLATNFELVVRQLGAGPPEGMSTGSSYMATGAK